MKLAILYKLLSVIFALVVLYGFMPTPADAAYPGRCNACRTPGSWCVEDGGGYDCGASWQCGPPLGLTPDCPSGCTCAYARYLGGALACGNFCITVLSCINTSPSPTPTPTPIPTGTVRGRIVVDGVATRSPGSPPCSGAPEYNATVSVSNPGGGSVTASTCAADGPMFTTTAYAGPHSVTVTEAANTYVGYTACTNDTSCHSSPPTPGSLVNVDVPAGGFVDIWWHYSSPGTLKIQAKTSSLSCPDLVDNTSYYPAALGTMGVAGVPGGSISGNEKTWTNVLTQPGGKQYTITAGTIPEGFAAGSICWDSARGRGAGATTYLDPNDTVTWHVGLIPPAPWVQVAGGDVYASSQVGSSIPSHTPPHEFNLAGAGGVPGIVIYGTDYDFDSDPSEKSPSNVSSEEWLAPDVYDDTVQYYSAFYTLLGSPTNVSWSGNTPPDTCLSIPCYAPGPGPYSISVPWNIAAGEKYVILVNDDLNINQEIKVADGGFLAFIVKGNISVASSVGTAVVDSEEPHIEGVYIAGGNIDTGSGTNKLVAEGMFIANSFTLNRDFEGAANEDNPAELFIYGPRFLVSMPEEMSEAVLRWGEVNP